MKEEEKVSQRIDFEKPNYNKSMDLYQGNMKQPMPTNLENNDMYLSEIDRLKKEINDLKKNNEYLSTQLKEEQRKNCFLSKKQKKKMKIQFWEK